MKMMHLNRFACTLGIAALLIGCAVGPQPVGTRFSYNVIEREPFSYSIHALNVQQEYSMNFTVLKTVLSNALNKRGNQTSLHQPRVIFLLGYASEIGVETPYENYVVLLGYNAINSQPVYQARVKVDTKTARIDQVGALVLEELVADLSKAGSSIEPLSIKLGDL